MGNRLRRGYTMIELMISLAIAGLLLVLAMPGYTVWIADGEIRNGAQSVAEGIRAAQSAAISRNFNTQFVLGAAGWTVQMADPPNTVLQTASFLEGSAHATFVGVDSFGVAATTIAFNALGQVIPAGANLVKVDVSLPSLPTSRALRVLVGRLVSGVTLSGVKLCDPAFAFPDPKGCPP